MRSGSSSGCTAARWRPRPSLGRGEVRPQPGGPRGEPPRAPGRPRLRRNDRDVPRRATKCRRPRSPPGVYRHISGNEATALGFLAASVKAKLPALLWSYPITPASDVLHELAKLRNFGVKTFQAEDEIAAMGAAIGAAYGGHLALTGTSGPGLALKSEGLNLAVMTELPLVVIDVQRAGPSTGMPTKTEQSDLLQAMYRTQRRLARRDHRPGDALRVLRDGDRGFPHRPQVHGARHLPQRRLPRQRLRAVADSLAR